jgi:hypothetical protein
MPTSTYTPLATITLTGTDSEIVFASIPSSYRDLILVIGNMTSSAANTLYCRVNGDTGSNYSYVFALGSGSVTDSNQSTSTGAGLLLGGLYGIPSATPTTTVTQFMDYSTTDKHKVSVSRYNSSSNETSMSAARWASTAAINSLTIRVAPSGSFQSGSTFSLFGVIA